MEVSLRYADFWPGFDPERTLFTRVLRSIFPNRIQLVTDPGRHVDLEIVSVFPFTSRPHQAFRRLLAHVNDEVRRDYDSRVNQGFRTRYVPTARRRLWYSGENRRAPSGMFDGTIGFDRTDAESLHVFFPHWMLRLNWDGMPDEFEIRPRISEMMCSRAPLRRRMAACSLSNRRETHRENVVKAVRAVMTVDLFGAANRNPVASKMTAMQDYALQVCTENDLYPNYVTEKLQESWMGRNVPIWSGLDDENWFNKDAIIDVTHLTASEIRHRLSQLSADEVMHRQSLPLLNKEPSLTPLVELFRQVLS